MVVEFPRGGCGDVANGGGHVLHVRAGVDLAGHEVVAERIELHGSTGKPCFLKKSGEACCEGGVVFPEERGEIREEQAGRVFRQGIQDGEEGRIRQEGDFLPGPAGLFRHKLHGSVFHLRAGEEEQAAENARRQQIEKRRALSAMRAQYGASGAALSSGSPLAQLGQAASDMTLASNDTLRAGVIGRSSAMTQASLFRAQGQMAKMSAPSTASLAGNITGIWANATENAAMAYSVMNPSENSPKTPPKK